VTLETVRRIGSSYECRVRLADGTPDEAIITAAEAAAILGQGADSAVKCHPADAERIRLLVESARIHLAYAHDRQFADRVFDVIGEVLSLNDVNLPEMLREAEHDSSSRARPVFTLLWCRDFLAVLGVRYGRFKQL
jgi:hypothetical protein